MTRLVGDHDFSVRTLLGERAGVFVRWAQEAEGFAHKRKVVHKLRTSARRLESACKAAGPGLRRAHAKRVVETVRTLRREAGAARDCDVIGKRLASGLAGIGHPAKSAAVGYLLARLGADRDAATERLTALAGSCSERVRTLADDLVACEKKNAPNVGAISGEGLRDAALRFATASERDLTDLELLHELRKDGKRLRYCVEVFEPILPPALAREVLARMRDFQQRLGVINDRHVELLLVTGIAERADSAPVRAGLSMLGEDLSRVLDREHASFVRWWWDVGAAQQLLGCAHELSVVRAMTGRGEGGAAVA